MGQAGSKPPERAAMAEKTGVFANRDKGLTEVPAKVFQIPGLRTLDLSHNRILKVPPTIRTLAPKLKQLNLDHNKLTSLPSEICTLNELQLLNISNNALESLPDALGALSKLKTLVVSHNKLNALPDSIVGMVSLASLDASYNRLSAIPTGFGALEALTAADLSNNQIGTLPSGLDKLKRIKDIDLRANAPLVVHGRIPEELLTSTPIHRLEVDPELLDTDGLLLPSAAGSDEALAAYKARRKARIDKEMHAKEKGGDISFGQ